MNIEEIKKLLAKIDDGDNQDVHEAILKAFAELDEQLSDITEAHKQVMQERCAPDEHHCTCVPFLRQRIAELEALIEKLKCCNNCTHSEDDFDCELGRNAYDKHKCDKWEAK